MEGELAGTVELPEPRVRVAGDGGVVAVKQGWRDQARGEARGFARDLALVDDRDVVVGCEPVRRCTATHPASDHDDIVVRFDICHRRGGGPPGI